MEEEIIKNTQATELAVTLNNIFQENTISKSDENSYSGVYIDEDDVVNIGIKFGSIEAFEQYSRNTKSIIDKFTNYIRYITHERARFLVNRFE